jgi:polysaccharide biosynthesis/export protein
MWRLPLSRRYRLPQGAPCMAKARSHPGAVLAKLIPVTAAVLVVGSLAGCGAALNSDVSATGFPAANQSDAAKTAAAMPSASTPTHLVTSALGGATDAGKPSAITSGATKGATATASAKTSASAAKAAAQLTASATPGSNAYKIGALDVLEISVFKVPEMSKSVQVADSGTANFPLVGDIQVVGRTAQQVERDLAAKLGAKYLQNPQVTLFVKEYNSQRVTIEGAVKKPGVFPIRGQGSLMQFIAMSEGLDPNAGSEVVIFRQVDGKRVAGRFDISQIRSGDAPDPPLQSGDVIVVQSSLMKETFNNFIKVLPLVGVFATVL